LGEYIGVYGTGCSVGSLLVSDQGLDHEVAGDGETVAGNTNDGFSGTRDEAAEV